MKNLKNVGQAVNDPGSCVYHGNGIRIFGNQGDK